MKKQRWSSLGLRAGTHSAKTDLNLEDYVKFVENLYI